MGETIFNSIRGINGQRDAVFNKAILAAAGHKYVKLGSEHILPSYLATDGTLPKLLANTAYTVYYPNVQNNDIKTIENYFEGKPQALLKPQSPITNYVVTVKIPGGKTYSVGYGWFRNNGRTLTLESMQNIKPGGKLTFFCDASSMRQSFEKNGLIHNHAYEIISINPQRSLKH